MHFIKYELIMNSLVLLRFPSLSHTPLSVTISLLCENHWVSLYKDLTLLCSVLIYFCDVNAIQFLLLINAKYEIFWSFNRLG